MSYYECKRCSFRSSQKIGMTRHLNKLNKCIKNIDSYKYSDEELYDLSLCIINNKKPISINNNYYCEDCDKFFSTKGNLVKHLRKKNCKNVQEKEDKPEVIVTPVNNINNIQNINNTQINNITINQEIKICNYYNIKLPIGFDDDWDLSNISLMNKLLLLCSSSKFSDLLKSILSNDENLNVILDNDENGIVYKNDDEKYIIMKKEEILDKSFDKLYKQLHFVFDELKNSYDKSVTNYDKIIEDEKINVQKRYNDYKENSQNLNKRVKAFLCDIFQEKNQEAMAIMQDYLKNSVEKNEKHYVEGY